jgi:hypothetical protein
MPRKANDQILRTAWFCRLRTYGRDPTWRSALTVQACGSTAESWNRAEHALHVASKSLPRAALPAKTWPYLCRRALRAASSEALHSR